MEAPPLATERETSAGYRVTLCLQSVTLQIESVTLVDRAWPPLHPLAAYEPEDTSASFTKVQRSSLNVGSYTHFSIRQHTSAYVSIRQSAARSI